MSTDPNFPRPGVPGYVPPSPYPGAGGPPFPPPTPVDPRIAEAASKKLAAGLCGILLGAFGVHKFILGYSTSGIIMLICSISCVGYPVMHIIGLVEGIIYLTKSDAEFYQMYMVNKKEWF